MKQKNLPVPVMLVMIGTGLSFTPYFSSINITADMIYSIFIPGHLFISAYRFPFKSLRKHAGIISFLSTMSIVLTVLILGVVIYYVGLNFTPFTFLSAFLLASILTPAPTSPSPPIVTLGQLLFCIIYPSFLFDMINIYLTTHTGNSERLSTP